MEYSAPKESYPGRISEVTIGTDKAVTFGGENTLPFHFFEGSIPHRPVIAYEIQDVPPDDWPDTVKSVYEGVSQDPAAWAKFCEEKLNAKAVVLRLVGTHPDRQNHSAEQAKKVVSEVLSAIKTPLIILGSNHIEKDLEILVAVAEAAKGRNSIIGKAQEGNYKTITAAAMAHNHKLIAMSELDINLSKQLNILITQMGFPKHRLIIDPMCSALGYGIEYTYSVMERIRIAALIQNDVVIQSPIFGDVGIYVWKVKETQTTEEELSQWGSLKERAIAWEALTASAMLIAGAELIVMRHPEAVASVEKFIDELMK